ncbi:MULTISPECIES: arsenate reductase (glutaredoxin) [unclassified Robiginitalea]|uniref:arsenate reductase (glutaredoxin) n=1 Tax=Robiginitalea TaxID=252306 RepID=UPI00234BF1BA|nr:MULTISPECIES: arsenate reductase (glutaredoxin) [unclassified Robiginitalea]MDC6354193.1 arsenate reductase (glutaredoxin) [Robiginitalea sp. PM2]MDC6374460.1 arsenate reductase (glutaredoxin) [Robiginitalea sp. SP8]
MYTIYHNPRCRKSREGLAILEASGKPFEIVRYLNDPPTGATLRELLDKLGMPARSLIRTGEAVWKASYKGKELSEEELIAAMSEHPKLIERPIVASESKAVLGRPPEAIKNFLTD